MNLEDEVLEHRLGDFKIRNDPVFHWANRLHIIRRSPEHFFCVGPDSDYSRPPFEIRFDRHNRRFGQYDPLASHVHKSIGRAEIDGHIIGKEARYRVKKHLNVCPEKTDYS